MPDTTPTPFASYWLAAAEAGYAHREDWANWADRYIERCTDLPDWVINLSLSRTREELWRGLAPQIHREQLLVADRPQFDNAVLGYLWLRLERGDFDLRACLELAGRHADAYDTDDDCETFYSLLTRLEAGGDVQAEASALFAPYRDVAHRQWQCLMSEEA